MMFLPARAFAFFNADALSCMGGKIISSPFPKLFIFGAGALSAFGALYAVIQIIKTSLLLNNIRKETLSPPVSLEKIIRKLNLESKVVFVKNKDPFSFCGGFFRPFIFISDALAKSLTAKELEAVLLHEQSHLKSRDPLKLLIGKTFSAVFFFLPVIRDLHKNSEGASEFLADQWAVTCQKKSAFLKNAMKKILTSAPNLTLVSNASSPEYFEIRVRRLVNPKIKYKLKFSFLGIASAFLFVFAAVVLFNVPADAHMTAIPGKERENCHQTQKQQAYIPEVDKKCSHYYTW